LSNRLEFSKAPFGVHSTFDGSTNLLENGIQVLRGSVSTTITQSPFLVGDVDRTSFLEPGLELVLEWFRLHSVRGHPRIDWRTRLGSTMNSATTLPKP